ncbi:MAG: ATP-binding protein, partial [Bacteroidota bacterium]
CLAGAVERCEEDPFPRADGHLDWVRWEIRPWYEETGRVGGIILFSEVITGRKLAERAIRDTNEKLARAQAMAHIGSWEHDLATDELHWSQEMYQIMGFVPGTSVSSREALRVYPLEELTRFRQAVHAALYQHAPYSMDYSIVRSDGTRRDIHDEGEVAWDDLGNPLRIYGTTQDITARKQVEKQLQALNVELEQRVLERTHELSRANRAKDEFLANMSHELRTPLNTVLGLSESLLEQRRGTLNEKQIQSIKLIAASGQHLLELINDILEVSKIEAGKLDLRPALVSIREVCESSLSFIRQLALRKSIAVEFTYDESLTSLYADPQRLKQILINLLTNAVKFTPEAGRVRLDVQPNAERDQILFAVTDTGIGIAAEDLRKLFVPFTQLDSSLARQYAGTGLGLALVQKLTDLHGGSVQVESEVNRGSRFTIILPLYEGLCEQTLFRSVVETVNARQEAASSSPSAQRRTVLLAEDNQINAEMVVEYLEAYGYRVIVARDGEEALQKVAEVNPAIILMDIQMPKLDGLEATRLLRREPRFASIPIVALTALAMAGDKERCLEAGVD